MAALQRSPLVAFGAILALMVVAITSALAPLAGAQEGRGSITVRVYNCPAGMRPETMVGDVCDGLVTKGINIALTTPTGQRLTLADATNQNGIYTWSGLAFGAYRIKETRLPAGHDTYVVNQPPAGPKRVRLSRTTPNLDVAIYNFRPAEETATLTIHNRLCPAGYTGTNHYQVCHDTPTGAGLEFTVDGPETATKTTKADGNVVFDLDPGQYTVRGGVPGDFASLDVFCARAATPGSEFPIRVLGGGVRGPDDPTGIRLSLAPGDDIVCDWYNTPDR